MKAHLQKHEAAEPERTLRLSVREGAVWSVMAGAGELFFAPYAIFLGAGSGAVAFIAALPHVVGTLAQFAGARIVDRLGARKDFIVPAVTLQGLLYVPLALLPLLLPVGLDPLGWALVAVALVTFTGQAAAPAWTSMMGDVVPPDVRGAYFGFRSSVVLVSVFASQLAAGGVLAVAEHRDAVSWGYACIFLAAFAARMVSSRMLAAHVDPPYRPEPGAGPFRAVLAGLRGSNFFRFSLFFALFLGAINVAAPFFTLYVLRDLDWSYAAYTVNQATFLGAQMLALKAWGRLGDRHGNKAVMLSSGWILTIVPVLWMISRDYGYLLAVQFISGIAWSGFSLGAQNFLYDAVLPGRRVKVSAYVALLNGACAAAGSLLVGAWLASRLPSGLVLAGKSVSFTSSLPLVFAVSAVLRMTTFLVMRSRFREVKEDIHPSHPATLILRAAGGAAVAGAFRRLQRLRW